MNETDKQKFVNDITLKITKYEKERKKRLLNLIFQQIGILILICFLLYLLSFGDIFYKFVIITILFCSTLWFFQNINRQNKNYKNYLKSKCKKYIFKVLGISMIKDVGTTVQELRKSNLFSIFTDVEQDDVISGCYKSTEYEISETKLTLTLKDIPWTVFKGIIISFKSNKNIEAPTIITSKKDINIRNFPIPANYLIIISLCFLVLGIFTCYMLDITSLNSITVEKILFLITSNWLTILCLLAILLFYLYQKKQMQSSKLEDISFDKRFNVHTKDQVEARYLLTTGFMDRLNSLETAFGSSNKIKCSFFDDKIMFAIPNKKDLFELGSLFTPIGSTKSIEKFCDELTAVEEIIDHFKLNEHIGL